MSKYAGMTVNERLFISGLMDKFDIAVKNKNIDSLIAVLKEIELTDVSIDQILRQLHLNE